MSKVARRSIVLAVGLSVFLLTVAVAGSRTPDSRTADTRLAASSTTVLEGIPSAAVDPANTPPPEAYRDIDALDRHRGLAQRPVELREALDDGGYEWSPTVLELEDLAFAREARRACFRAHATELAKPCNYSLDQVLAADPDATHEGRIVYARARPEPNSSVRCVQTARCIAAGRVGESVPIPEAYPEVAVTQAFQHAPMRPEMRDRSHLARVLDALRSDLAAFEAAAATDDLGAQHTIEEERRYIAAIEAWLEQLD